MEGLVKKKICTGLGGFFAILFLFSEVDAISVTLKGRYLSGHELGEPFATDWFGCVSSCQENPSCVSYNLNLRKEICQLNKKGGGDSSKELLHSPEYIFTQIKDWMLVHINQKLTFYYCNKNEKGLGMTSDNPAKSCKEILQKNRFAKSGAYYLSVFGEKSRVYCHMTDLGSCGGGGWTLVMKIDGNKPDSGLSGLSSSGEASACLCNCGSDKQCEAHGLGMTSDNPAKSCKEILQKNRFAKSGAYYLSVFGEKSRVYCHMTDLGSCGGGGWTLVMKIDGNKQTFSYSSPKWNSMAEYQPGFGVDMSERETLLATYWGTPFDRLCLGMKNTTTNWIAVPHEGISLLTLIKKQHTLTSLDVGTWKSLLPGSSLQTGCYKQGFNVTSGINSATARIGILAFPSECSGHALSRIGFGTGGYWYGQDDENSCGNEATGCYKQGFNVTSGINSATARIGILAFPSECSGHALSRIGFGTGGYWYGQDDENSCGNEAVSSGLDNGEKHTRAFGYVFIQ
ncbi:predicted protein [Nematostella vectensis]|uniref:Fibrinogen C-terminal domain-containing protein n=1 Tax=Nematostella vectensis TaxID=45351 RepID=A7RTH1_NEMVE|nr:predicted protein [Nematostella vectensis]|eukprot:XP_001637326.1 predicted protein [Nematostella vectensis]